MVINLDNLVLLEVLVKVGYIEKVVLVIVVKVQDFFSAVVIGMVFSKG